MMRNFFKGFGKPPEPKQPTAEEVVAFGFEHYEILKEIVKDLPEARQKLAQCVMKFKRMGEERNKREGGREHSEDTLMDYARMCTGSVVFDVMRHFCAIEKEATVPDAIEFALETPIETLMCMEVAACN